MPKKRPNRRIGQEIGPAQLEVLRYVLDHQPISVSDVAEHFSVTQGKARTTILTVMEKLREKGCLSREKVKGTYQYSAVAAKNAIMSDVIGNFVEGSLGGSISPFIAYLAESRGLSNDEIRELENLVDDLTSKPAKRKREK